MPRHIHARLTKSGWRYREWSTIVDAYCTIASGAGRMRAYLLDGYTGHEVKMGSADRDISERLERARTNGTSCVVDVYKRDVSGPWDTERCETCGGFHHAFEPAADQGPEGDCKACDDIENDCVHGPKCRRKR